MIRLFSRMPLLVFVVVFCGPALSQQPSALVQGIVVDAASNAPISKAIVELRVPGTRTAIASTRTDRDGNFYLPNIAPGSYGLVATHAGHVFAEYGQRAPGSPGPALLLAAGQRITDARITMTAGGVISGRITDKGKPIGLADAVAVKAVWTEGQPSLTPVISVRTDDTGEFRLFWLPPGRYYVIGMVWDVANSVGTFVNSEDQDNGNFHAQRYIGRAVFMRATAGGIAENEAHVPVFYPGTADSQMAKAIEVQPGAVIKGLDIDASAVRTSRVRGRVLGISTQAGQPARTVVEARQLITVFNITPAQLPTAVVAPDGTFEMPTVAPGRYVVTARAGSDARTAGSDAIGRTVVDVMGTDVANVVISLSARLSLSGRVVIEGVPPATAERALASLRVALRTDPLLPNTTNTGVAVNPDGTFKMPDPSAGTQGIPGIPAGDYRVLVTPLLSPPAPDDVTPAPLPPVLQGLYVKSIRLGDVDVLNDRLRLQDQPRDPLTIVIGTRPGALEGRVLDDNQRPVHGATVVLIHDNNLRYRVNEAFVFSDTSGRFEFQNVPPGNYKLFAWENIDRGAWQDPEFMRGFETRGLPVRVEEGASASVNVRTIEK
jgi:Carboxypeptidase regulatory-like domain